MPVVGAAWTCFLRGYVYFKKKKGGGGGGGGGGSTKRWWDWIVLLRHAVVTVRRFTKHEARRIAVRAQLLDAERPKDCSRSSSG